MKKHTLACGGLDPHIWRSFWTLLMDLGDDDNLVEEAHLEDDDNLGGSIDDMKPMVIPLHVP